MRPMSLKFDLTDEDLAGEKSILKSNACYHERHWVWVTFLTADRIQYCKKQKIWSILSPRWFGAKNGSTESGSLLSDHWRPVGYNLYLSVCRTWKEERSSPCSFSPFAGKVGLSYAIFFPRQGLHTLRILELNNGRGQCNFSIVFMFC